ncbi:MAG: glutathione S-transferase [Geminicoccaceae bacterium]|jgi:glutathione S-transferase
MRLHSNPASPFGRKVKVLAMEAGLFDRLEIHTVQTTAVGPDPSLVADNPLGKIPCLVLDDSTALYDSRVICEYLDSLHAGSRFFPTDGPARWTALRLQALADGIMDAALLARYEAFLRPEANRWPAWIDGQLDKAVRGLERLEEVELANFKDRVDIGAVTVACALGYIDFRFPSLTWRDTRPGLTAWYETFALRPSMQATRPPG